MFLICRQVLQVTFPESLEQCPSLTTESVPLVGHLSDSTDKVLTRKLLNVDGHLVSRLEAGEKPFPATPNTQWAVPLVCFGVWACTFSPVH